ncbi:MAG: prepilin-type N-terminal cleavage/methylation domain-containing protein [Candidatus Muiribacteriota bacterium]
MPKKGFTLLELLIVIVVIGILAAVSVPRLMTFIDEGREGAVRSEIAAIRSASRLFYMHTGRHPQHPGELVLNSSGGRDGEGDSIEGWRGPYMEDSYDEVTVDAWGNEYVIIDRSLNPDGSTSNGQFYIEQDGENVALCGIIVASGGPSGDIDEEVTTFDSESDYIWDWLQFDGPPGN